MTDSCETCVFYRFAGVGLRGWSAGACHRHAPTPVAESGYGNMPVGKWPLVQSRDWCGEFKPKDSPDA